MDPCTTYSATKCPLLCGPSHLHSSAQPILQHNYRRPETSMHDCKMHVSRTFAGTGAKHRQQTTVQCCFTSDSRVLQGRIGNWTVIVHSLVETLVHILPCLHNTWYRHTCHIIVAEFVYRPPTLYKILCMKVCFPTLQSYIDKVVSPSYNHMLCQICHTLPARAWHMRAAQSQPGSNTCTSHSVCSSIVAANCLSCRLRLMCTYKRSRTMWTSKLHDLNTFQFESGRLFCVPAAGRQPHLPKSVHRYNTMTNQMHSCITYPCGNMPS